MGLFEKFNKKKRSEDIRANDSQSRRERTIDVMKKQDIAVCLGLPLLEDSTQMKLKDLDTICQRAVANLLVIQLGCDIDNGNYDEGLEIVQKMLDEFGVGDKINKKERSLIDGTYNRQNVIDVVWTYESYWSLVWALELVDDISDASNICDCEKAIRLVGDCKTYDEFKGNCKLRNIEEILDMLDIYYNYHWATTDKRINPDTKIGNLNPEVVPERRRGLEWLFSEEDDWFEISLDT